MHRNVSFTATFACAYEPTDPSSGPAVYNFTTWLYEDHFADLLTDGGQRARSGYQNYPWRAYGQVASARMYYGDNRCRLAQIKRQRDAQNIFDDGVATLPSSLPDCPAV